MSPHVPYDASEPSAATLFAVGLSRTGGPGPMTANVGKTTAFRAREPIAIWYGARGRSWHKAHERACTTACPLWRALREKLHIQWLLIGSRSTDRRPRMTRVAGGHALRMFSPARDHEPARTA